MGADLPRRNEVVHIKSITSDPFTGRISVRVVKSTSHANKQLSIRGQKLSRDVRVNVPIEIVW